jgi:hypothetical protein
VPAISRLLSSSSSARTGSFTATASTRAFKRIGLRRAERIVDELRTAAGELRSLHARRHQVGRAVLHLFGIVGVDRDVLEREFLARLVDLAVPDIRLALGMAADALDHVAAIAAREAVEALLHLERGEPAGDFLDVGVHRLFELGSRIERGAPFQAHVAGVGHRLAVRARRHDARVAIEPLGPALGELVARVIRGDLPEQLRGLGRLRARLLQPAPDIGAERGRVGADVLVRVGRARVRIDLRNAGVAGGCHQPRPSATAAAPPVALPPPPPLTPFHFMPRLDAVERSVPVAPMIAPVSAESALILSSSDCALKPVALAR